MPAQRRNVTVLFADVVDSTRMSNRLDLEDYNDLILSFFRASERAIENNSGLVFKFLGDGYAAQFGFPVAREHSPTEAIAAALDIQRLVREDALLSRHAVEVRIGVATGSVVIGEIHGSGAATESSLVGAVPALAARLQALARPGQILMSEATKDKVLQSVDFNDLGKFDLKGFDARQGAFEVRGLKPTPDRLTARFSRSSEYWGRDPEMNDLELALGRTRSGTGSVAFVSGEAGIGKSRFVHEFQKHSSAAGFDWLEASASPLQSRSPFALVRQVGVFDRAWNSTCETQVIDNAPAQTLAEQIHENLFKALLSEAQGKPLVLVFEDMQWADTASISFLGKLAERSNGQPWLLLLTSRDPSTAEMLGCQSISRIVLQPLSKDDCRSLVRSVVGDQLSSEVVDTIVLRSGGVPFFATELGSWYLGIGPDILLTELPVTVQDVILAKLGSFGETLPVLQAMSVLAEGCTPRSISALTGTTEDSVRSAMRLLCGDGILQAERSHSEGFKFSHAIFSDVVNQTLLREQRRSLHRHAAALIEEGTLEAQDAASVARHWRECGELERAVDALIEAARLQQSGGAYLEAQATLEHGLQVLKEGSRLAERDVRELRLHTLRSSVLQITLGYSAAETLQSNKRAAKLAERLGSSKEAFSQAVSRWMATSSAGHFVEAEALSQRVLSLSLSIGRPNYIAIGWMARATALGRLGQLKEYEAAFSKGEAYFADPLFRRLPGSIAQAYGNAALFDLIRGQVALSRNRAATALRSGLASASPYDQAYARYLVALFAVVLGADRVAYRLASSALGVARRANYPQFEATSEIVLGRAIAGLGSPDEGVSHILAGLRAMEGTSSNVGKSLYFTWLGEAERFRGARQQAIEAFERALSFNENERYFRSETMRLLALEKLDAGDRASSDDLLRKAWTSADEIGAGWLRSRVERSMVVMQMHP
jgi:class 3 adenylate cyclase/tetratricopeptide (TPR) repeat protein